MGRRSLSILLIGFAALFISPEPVLAYVGPGAGLTAIGAALAFVGGLVFAVVGFVWYPLKRIFNGRGKRRSSGPRPG